MNDDDTTAQASASGILGCLRLLAEEAASLGLRDTGKAIREALGVGEAESGVFTTPAIRVAGDGLAPDNLH